MTTPIIAIVQHNRACRCRGVLLRLSSRINVLTTSRCMVWMRTLHIDPRTNWFTTRCALLRTFLTNLTWASTGVTSYQFDLLSFIVLGVYTPSWWWICMFL